MARSALGFDAGGKLPAVPDGWHWVGRTALEDASPLKAPTGEMVAPPEDVLKLGIAALDLLENGPGDGQM